MLKWRCEALLYLAKDDYGAYAKVVVQNGGSVGRRGNLVDKEAAVMTLIKKVALSK